MLFMIDLYMFWTIEYGISLGVLLEELDPVVESVVLGTIDPD